MEFTEFLSLLGGVGLFLYGMTVMSSGLRSAAGDRLRGILERVTGSRPAGVLIGIVGDEALRHMDALDGGPLVGDELSRQLGLQHMPAITLTRLDEVGREVRHRPLNHARDDGTGHHLAMAHDGIGQPLLFLLGQVAIERQCAIERVQIVDKLRHNGAALPLHGPWHHASNDITVTLGHLSQDWLIVVASTLCQTGHLDELVSHTAQGRDHDDHRFLLACDNILDVAQAPDRANTGSSKFQYFHLEIINN